MVKSEKKKESLRIVLILQGKQRKATFHAYIVIWLNMVKMDLKDITCSVRFYLKRKDSSSWQVSGCKEEVCHDCPTKIAS